MFVGINTSFEVRRCRPAVREQVTPHIADNNVDLGISDKRKDTSSTRSSVAAVRLLVVGNPDNAFERWASRCLQLLDYGKGKECRGFNN